MNTEAVRNSDTTSRLSTSFKGPPSPCLKEDMDQLVQNELMLLWAHDMVQSIPEI